MKNTNNMIIDIHAHTSNHQMLGLHTKTATIQDLEAYAKKYNIEKIVLMATYFPFKGSGLSNYELLKRVQDKELFLIFGSLDSSGDIEQGVGELKELAKQKKIAGIKLYPGYQIFDCADEKIFPVYELALKYNLPVKFHTGELHHCCSRENRGKGEFRCGDYCRIDKYGDLSKPENILPVAKHFENVKFILSHLSNPYFSQLREVMRQCSNVYTDISGQFVSATEEDTKEYRNLIKEEIIEFLKLPNGADRLMFGTDFPIQSYEDSFAIIDSLNLNSVDKNKVLYQNAKKILDL